MGWGHSRWPPASGHVDKYNGVRQLDGVPAASGVAQGHEVGHRPPPKPTPPQSPPHTTPARLWERSQFMKLNKVCGRRPNPGEGASTPVGPAQLGLSTPCVLAFPPLPGGAERGQAPAWWPGSGSLGGAEVGEVGVLQGLLCRDALDGVALQEVLEHRRKASQGQAGPAAWAPPSPSPAPCPWSPAAGPCLWR